MKLAFTKTELLQLIDCAVAEIYITDRPVVSVIVKNVPDLNVEKELENFYQEIENAIIDKFWMQYCKEMKISVKKHDDEYEKFWANMDIYEDSYSFINSDWIKELSRHKNTVKEIRQWLRKKNSKRNNLLILTDIES